ncbi:hypothetical protein CB0940_06532 [Cercospora beticola]|uniref:Uncharacterized protein n=1 Tax=Cercospora beticola TaxID=122368 RepID=A0A2G5HZV0_CERBT|nr:hypothetical protein CB0940_06532 [Cercospora beticola]PIA97773.1 hypothetical protein CB0940_06532 [Cercospora beticola]WPA99170.1 hypothetical protein RHO25_003786 [Cercospora beticola]
MGGTKGHLCLPSKPFHSPTNNNISNSNKMSGRNSSQPVPPDAASPNGVAMNGRDSNDDSGLQTNNNPHSLSEVEVNLAHSLAQELNPNLPLATTPPYDPNQGFVSDHYMPGTQQSTSTQFYTENRPEPPHDQVRGFVQGQYGQEGSHNFDGEHQSKHQDEGYTGPNNSSGFQQALGHLGVYGAASLRDYSNGAGTTSTDAMDAGNGGFEEPDEFQIAPVDEGDDTRRQEAEARESLVHFANLQTETARLKNETQGLQAERHALRVQATCIKNLAMLQKTLGDDVKGSMSGLRKALAGIHEVKDMLTKVHDRAYEIEMKRHTESRHTSPSVPLKYGLRRGKPRVMYNVEELASESSDISDSNGDHDEGFDSSGDEARGRLDYEQPRVTDDESGHMDMGLVVVKKDKTSHEASTDESAESSLDDEVQDLIDEKEELRRIKKLRRCSTDAYAKGKNADRRVSREYLVHYKDDEDFVVPDDMVDYRTSSSSSEDAEASEDVDDDEEGGMGDYDVMDEE